MRIALIVVVACFCAVSNAVAQQATVKKFTVKPSGSVKMSEVEDDYGAEVYNLEMPSPDGNADKKKLREVKKQIEKDYPRKRLKALYKTTAAPSPTVAISYLADSLPGIPPDNDMAISKQNKSVNVMNSRIAVHDALTGTMIMRKALQTFSSPVDLQGSANHKYDPKVMYDQDADKFICVMLNNNNETNWIVLGFSRTNDPLGSWNFYKLYGDYSGDTTWFDYPSVSITDKEFFLTGNKIRFNTSWQEGFKQTIIYQIDKQTGYDSLDLGVQIWENIGFNGRNLRNLYPVKGGDGQKGPDQYFLSNRNFDVTNDTVFLVRIPDTIGSGNLNLTVTPLISNIPYGVPPNGRQPDTSVVLATNDARVLGAYMVEDEIQFVSTTLHQATGASAVYHGMISNFATNPTLHADYFVVDTLDFGYPNLSFSGYYGGGKKSSIISFNYTGPNTYPGIGAIYYDGTQYSDLVKVKTGDSSIRQLVGKEQRWGDYMGSQPDWNSFGSVWIVGIYGRKDKNYGNYMAKLVSPYLNSVKEQAIPEKSYSLYPNPAYHFIKFEFDLEKDADLAFTIYDIQGKRVDQILQHQCKAGRNKIQLNIGTLPHGIYFLKGQNKTGQDVMVKQFIKE